MAGRTGADLYVLPLAFALAPVLNLLLTWRSGWLFAPEIDGIIKLYVPPLLAVEITAFIAAAGQGLLPTISRQLALPMAALVVVAWISAAMAPNQGVSLGWTAVWMMHLGFGFASARLFDVSASIRAIMIGFLLFALLLAIRAAIAPVADWTNDPPGLDQIRRYAYYAAPVAAIAMAALASRARSLAFFSASAAWGMIFWNGARGAVVALAAAAFVGLWISREFRRTIPLVLAAVLTGLILSWMLPAWDPVWGMSHFSSAADSGRYETWRATIQAVLKRPLIGWGEAQASRFVGWAQPHNVVLQVLLAWGFVGVCLIVWPAYALFRRAFETVRSKSELLPLGLAIWTLAFYSLFDGTLYHVLPTSIFALCVGLVVGQSRAGPSCEGLVAHGVGDSESLRDA